MINRIKIKGLIYAFVMVSGLLTIASCGKSNEPVDNTNYFYPSLKEEETSEVIPEEEISREMYMIVEVNSVKETMKVFRYATGLEYQYHYGLTTEFFNKYGDHTSVANFKVGDVIYVSETDSQGRVKQVTKADEVWVYEDVKRFSLDCDMNVLEIGDSKYKLNNETMVFSGDQEVKATDISDEDILEVVGIDNDILSISITTGHGTLQLTHTDLFEGSFLQLNNNIFVEITPDMDMELPEGNYHLVVANDGWGGNKDIAIKRGETTKVNLDKIKGDGPKSGLIQFTVDVAGAEIYIDNEKIDYSSPVSIKYGKHSLTVVAEGYETWSKILFVNSEEATIMISLNSGEAETKNDNNSGGSTSGNESSDNSEKDSENSEEKSDESNSSSEADDLTDYLSTLADLLSTIY